MKLSAPVAAGDLNVRATIAPADPGAESFTDILRLDLASSLGQPMLFRRGPATGNRLVPAGTFQFSRTERAHLEFAAGADTKTGTARLLDKAGEPLAIPVTTGERTDAQTLGSDGSPPTSRSRRSERETTSSNSPLGTQRRRRK